MYSSVKSVHTVSNYKLHLTFVNGETRILDMTPYLDWGIFSELKDIKLFDTVRVSFDTIVWNNEADLDPEFVYKHSIPIKETVAPKPKKTKARSPRSKVKTSQ